MGTPTNISHMFQFSNFPTTTGWGHPLSNHRHTPPNAYDRLNIGDHLGSTSRLQSRQPTNTRPARRKTDANLPDEVTKRPRSARLSNAKPANHLDYSVEDVSPAEVRRPHTARGSATHKDSRFADQGAPSYRPEASAQMSQRVHNAYPVIKDPHAVARRMMTARRQARAMAPEAAALKIQATVRGWIVKRQHTCIALKARKAELDLVLTEAAEETTKFEPWVFDHSLEAKKVNGVPVPLIEYEEKLLRHQLKLDGMQSSGPAAGVMRHWRKKANCALQARLDLVDTCREGWQQMKAAEVA